jgi:hypothetical protein
MNTKLSFFRVIGDVHGKFDKYVHLAREAYYSLCVGDVGFEYSYVDRMLDYHNHKIVGGNHDNYTKKDGQFIKQPPHFLKDFGVWNIPGIEPIFYVRGAWSIDQAYRLEGRDWWPDEELTYARGMEAIDLYKTIKPKLVVTHCCPGSIIPLIPFERLFGNDIKKTLTDNLLDSMYDIHQPDMWAFGHYHHDFSKIVGHPKTQQLTRFICLNELSYIDFPENSLNNSEFEPIIHTHSV